MYCVVYVISFQNRLDAKGKTGKKSLNYIFVTHPAFKSREIEISEHFGAELRSENRIQLMDLQKQWDALVPKVEMSHPKSNISTIIRDNQEILLTNSLLDTWLRQLLLELKQHPNLDVEKEREHRTDAICDSDISSSLSISIIDDSVHSRALNTENKTTEEDEIEDEEEDISDDDCKVNEKTDFIDEDEETLIERHADDYLKIKSMEKSLPKPSASPMLPNEYVCVACGIGNCPSADRVLQPGYKLSDGTIHRFPKHFIPLLMNTNVQLPFSLHVKESFHAEELSLVIKQSFATSANNSIAPEDINSKNFLIWMVMNQKLSSTEKEKEEDKPSIKSKEMILIAINGKFVGGLNKEQVDEMLHASHEVTARNGEIKKPIIHYLEKTIEQETRGFQTYDELFQCLGVEIEALNSSLRWYTTSGSIPSELKDKIVSDEKKLNEQYPNYSTSGIIVPYCFSVQNITTSPNEYGQTNATTLYPGDVIFSIDGQAIKLEKEDDGEKIWNRILNDDNGHHLIGVFHNPNTLSNSTKNDRTPDAANDEKQQKYLELLGHSEELISAKNFQNQLEEEQESRKYSVEFQDGSLGMGLAMMIHSKKIVVRSLNDLADGKPGQARACGKIHLGDTITQLNDEEYHVDTLNDFTSKLLSMPRPLKLTLIRSKNSHEHHHNQKKTRKDDEVEGLVLRKVYLSQRPSDDCFQTTFKRGQLCLVVPAKGKYTILDEEGNPLEENDVLVQVNNLRLRYWNSYLFQTQVWANPRTFPATLWIYRPPQVPRGIWLHESCIEKYSNIRQNAKKLWEEMEVAAVMESILANTLPRALPLGTCHRGYMYYQFQASMNTLYIRILEETPGNNVPLDQDKRPRWYRCRTRGEFQGVLAFLDQSDQFKASSALAQVIRRRFYRVFQQQMSPPTTNTAIDDQYIPDSCPAALAEYMNHGSLSVRKCLYYDDMERKFIGEIIYYGRRYLISKEVHEAECSRRLGNAMNHLIQFGTPFVDQLVPNGFPLEDFPKFRSRKLFKRHLRHYEDTAASAHELDVQHPKALTNSILSILQSGFIGIDPRMVTQQFTLKQQQIALTSRKAMAPLLGSTKPSSTTTTSFSPRNVHNHLLLIQSALQKVADLGKACLSAWATYCQLPNIMTASTLIRTSESCFEAVKAAFISIAQTPHHAPHDQSFAALFHAFLVSYLTSFAVKRLHGGSMILQSDAVFVKTFMDALAVSLLNAMEPTAINFEKALQSLRTTVSSVKNQNLAGACSPLMQGAIRLIVGFLHESQYAQRMTHDDTRVPYLNFTVSKLPQYAAFQLELNILYQAQLIVEKYQRRRQVCDFSVTFEEGPLGIVINQLEDGVILVGEFSSDRDGNPGQARRSGKINIADVVWKVNDQRVDRVGLNAFQNLVRQSPRPLVVTFRRYLKVPNKEEEEEEEKKASGHDQKPLETSETTKMEEHQPVSSGSASTIMTNNNNPAPAASSSSVVAATLSTIVDSAVGLSTATKAILVSENEKPNSISKPLKDEKVGLDDPSVSVVPMDESSSSSSSSSTTTTTTTTTSATSLENTTTTTTTSVLSSEQRTNMKKKDQIEEHSAVVDIETTPGAMVDTTEHTANHHHHPRKRRSSRTPKPFIESMMVPQTTFDRTSSSSFKPLKTSPLGSPTTIQAGAEKNLPAFGLEVIDPKEPTAGEIGRLATDDLDAIVSRIQKPLTPPCFMLLILRAFLFQMEALVPREAFRRGAWSRAIRLAWAEMVYASTTSAGDFLESVIFFETSLDGDYFEASWKALPPQSSRVAVENATYASVATRVFALNECLILFPRKHSSYYSRKQQQLMSDAELKKSRASSEHQLLSVSDLSKSLTAADRTLVQYLPVPTMACFYRLKLDMLLRGLGLMKDLVQQHVKQDQDIPDSVRVLLRVFLNLSESYDVVLNSLYLIFFKKYTRVYSS